MPAVNGRPNSISRAQERDRLLQSLTVAVFAYWFSLGAVLALRDSGHGDFAIASLVAVAMASVWLPMHVAKSARFLARESPYIWGALTLVLGPLGALIGPVVQARRLLSY